MRRRGKYGDARKLVNTSEPGACPNCRRQIPVKVGSLLSEMDSRNWSPTRAKLKEIFEAMASSQYEKLETKDPSMAAAWAAIHSKARGERFQCNGCKLWQDKQAFFVELENSLIGPICEACLKITANSHLENVDGVIPDVRVYVVNISKWVWSQIESFMAVNKGDVPEEEPEEEDVALF